MWGTFCALEKDRDVTREYFKKLEDLKKGKNCIADFSDEEWEEYLEVHRSFMNSLTLWFRGDAVDAREEYLRETEEAADGKGLVAAES